MNYRTKYIFRGLVPGILFFLWTVLSSQRLQAQDLITTMAEQLAKLELYLQEAKQGYNIVQQGLTTIGNIKKGDFDLHSLFFSSLMLVNPVIKGYGKIADIIAMQVQILYNSKQYTSQFVSSGVYNRDELTYLAAVYSNLSDLTGQDIDELTGIITDGDWQMTDDQRLTRIDLLYTKVSEKYAFIQSFSSRVQLEALQRTKDKNGLQALGKLFQP
jgi:hypothetical protein